MAGKLSLLFFFLLKIKIDGFCLFSFSSRESTYLFFLLPPPIPALPILRIPSTSFRCSFFLFIPTLGHTWEHFFFFFVCMSVCADLERFNIIKKNYVYLKIKKKVSYLLLSFEIFISFSLFF